MDAEVIMIFNIVFDITCTLPQDGRAGLRNTKHVKLPFALRVAEMVGEAIKLYLLFPVVLILIAETDDFHDYVCTLQRFHPNVFTRYAFVASSWKKEEREIGGGGGGGGSRRERELD